MSTHAHIVRWRYAFVMLQGLALVGFIGVFWARSKPVHLAAHPLAADHVLTRADLFSPSGEHLIGQALRGPVRAGDPITSEQVKSPPDSAASAAVGSVAALVTMTEDLTTRRALKPGASVVVRRHALPDLPGAVIASTCQRKTCLLTVALEATPPQERLTAQAFSAAELLPRPAASAAP